MCGGVRGIEYSGPEEREDICFAVTRCCKLTDDVIVVFVILVSKLIGSNKCTSFHVSYSE